MKEVFSDQDYTRVGFFKSVLDDAGIPCYIQNQHTHTLMASLPLAIFHPKLCVVHDEDYEAALDLLRPHHEQSGQPLEEWQCLQCGESVPGEFQSCWKCEAMREEPPAPLP